MTSPHARKSGGRRKRERTLSELRRCDKNLALPVLVVVDKRGHVLERIGRTWAAYGHGVKHEVLVSENRSSYSLVQRAGRIGLVHWLDVLRFLSCASAVKVPQVVTVHHLTADMEPRVVPMLRFADAITTASRLWQGELERLTGRPVWLLPYSVNTDCFAALERRSASRSSAGIMDGEYVMGFVGKAGADHAGRKGTDLLLALLKTASERWRDLCLLLVGPGWDRLARSVEALGVRVVQYEFQTTEETVAAYRLMDVLLVTSNVEGGPCTVLEAMACGVPVITSVVGHVPEIVHDGRTGFLCPRRSPDEYVEKIASLRTDPSQRERIRSQARALVVRERDDRVVIPEIDFVGLYGAALTHYNRVSPLLGSVRTVPRARLYARHVARRFLRGGEV